MAASDELPAIGCGNASAECGVSVDLVISLRAVMTMVAGHSVPSALGHCTDAVGVSPFERRFVDFQLVSGAPARHTAPLAV